MTFSRSLLLTLAGAAASVAVFGCEAIAGIEDRTYVEDTGGASEELCREYCGKVMANCIEANAVYDTEATCMGVCMKLPAGDTEQPEGNTVACRIAQAELAAGREPNVHCPFAGPGGGDPGNGSGCGTDCESYCMLLEKTCPSEYDTVVDCEAACQGFVAKPGFDVIEDRQGDSIECRLIQLSAATLDPDTRCSNAQPSPIVDTPCANDIDDQPTCAEYCKLVTAACTGEYSVYESEAQCLAACEVMPLGTYGDTTPDTVGCRKYHSYSSLAAPEVHCSHAGANGDGHCGDENCTAYCALLEAACATEFSGAYADQAACSQECMSVPGAGPDRLFTVDATGDNVRCRTVNVLRALVSPDAATCAAAMGGAGECS